MKLVRNKWLVTHEDSCPRHPSTNSLARTKAVRIAQILNDPATQKSVVFEAVELLGLLVKTSWLDLGRCKASLLSCGATAQMDRVEVEEVIDHFLRSASP